MTVKVASEQEVLHDVVQVLFEHLSPSTVARFLAGWQMGSGDYVLLRRQLFGDETVASLTEKIRAYERAGEAQVG